MGKIRVGESHTAIGRDHNGMKSGFIVSTGYCTNKSTAKILLIIFTRRWTCKIFISTNSLSHTGNYY